MNAAACYSAITNHFQSSPASRSWMPFGIGMPVSARHETSGCQSGSGRLSASP